MENIRHNIQWLKQIDTSLLHLSTNILWLPCIICTRELLLLHHHLLHLFLHSQTHTLTGSSQENGEHCVMFTATCYLVVLFFHICFFQPNISGISKIASTVTHTICLGSPTHCKSRQACLCCKSNSGLQCYDGFKMWHWYRLHQKTSNFTLVTFEMSTGAIISSRVLIQTLGTNQETSVHTHTDKECCVSYRTMIWVPNRGLLGVRANTSTHTHTHTELLMAVSDFLGNCCIQKSATDIWMVQQWWKAGKIDWLAHIWFQTNGIRGL